MPTGAEAKHVSRRRLPSRRGKMQMSRIIGYTYAKHRQRQFILRAATMSWATGAQQKKYISQPSRRQVMMPTLALSFHDAVTLLTALALTHPQHFLLENKLTPATCTSSRPTFKTVYGGLMHTCPLLDRARVADAENTSVTVSPTSR